MPSGEIGRQHQVFNLLILLSNFIDRFCHVCNGDENFRGIRKAGTGTSELPEEMRYLYRSLVKDLSMRDVSTGLSTLLLIEREAPDVCHGKTAP